MLYGAQRMQRTQRLLILLDHLLDAVLRAVHPNWRVTRRRARCGQQKRVGSGEESEQRKQARHVYEIASETAQSSVALSWQAFEPTALSHLKWHLALDMLHRF